MQETKNKIVKLIDEGFGNGILSSNEYIEMSPKDNKPGSFYVTCKVHKEHEKGKAHSDQ